MCRLAAGGRPCAASKLAGSIFLLRQEGGDDGAARKAAAVHRDARLHRARNVLVLHDDLQKLCEGTCHTEAGSSIEGTCTVPWDSAFQHLEGS